MAKKRGGKVLNFVAWLTGVIVSLAVGFAMTKGGALYGNIPYVPAVITAIAGWIVVITTLISVVMAILNQ